MVELVVHAYGCGGGLMIFMGGMSGWTVAMEIAGKQSTCARACSYSVGMLEACYMYIELRSKTACAFDTIWI